jgi:hypothetical protein
VDVLNTACGTSDIAVAIATLLVSIAFSVVYTNWRIERMLAEEKLAFLPKLAEPPKPTLLQTFLAR